MVCAVEGQREGLLSMLWRVVESRQDILWQVADAWPWVEARGEDYGNHIIYLGPVGELCQVSIERLALSR